MKSLWQEGQCPTLSPSSLAWGGGGRGAGAESRPKISAREDPASHCQEPGMIWASILVGHGLDKWWVRALDWVPGRWGGAQGHGGETQA